MESKTVKISELLDDYTDNEFCIEGETEVQNEEIKDIVKSKVNKGRKPVLKIIGVAAAAAVFAAAAMAVTSVMTTRFSLPGGGEIIKEQYSDGIYSLELGFDDDLLQKEDGRLYLTVGNDKTDVTQIIDTKKPYILSYENGGAPAYVIVGGTVEHYSYLELVCVDGEWTGLGKTDNQWEKEIIVNISAEEDGLWGFVWDAYDDVNGNGVYDLGEQTYRYGYNNDPLGHVDIPADWRDTSSMAWLIEALDSLGFINAPEEGAEDTSQNITNSVAEESGYLQTSPALPEI